MQLLHLSAVNLKVYSLNFLSSFKMYTFFIYLFSLCICFTCNAMTEVHVLVHLQLSSKLEKDSSYSFPRPEFPG